MGKQAVALTISHYDKARLPRLLKASAIIQQIGYMLDNYFRFGQVGEKPSIIMRLSDGFMFYLTEWHKNQKPTNLLLTVEQTSTFICITTFSMT